MTKETHRLTRHISRDRDDRVIGTSERIDVALKRLGLCGVRQTKSGSDI